MPLKIVKADGTPTIAITLSEAVNKKIKSEEASLNESYINPKNTSKNLH